MNARFRRRTPRRRPPFTAFPRRPGAAESAFSTGSPAGEGAVLRLTSEDGQGNKSDRAWR
jgi:hypothetical protein